MGSNCGRRARGADVIRNDFIVRKRLAGKGKYRRREREGKGSLLLISKLQLELADLKVQVSVRSWAPGFVNAASKLRQMW